MKDIDISVIVPCYRSEKTIESVVNDIVDTLNQRKGHYEVILINDCSPDNVWIEIKKLVAKYKIVKGINFTRNFGQHSALMAGYRESSGDIVVALDDDGQTDPKELWKLVDKINEGYDIVLARYPELKETPFRRMGSKLNRLMAETLVEKPKTIVGSSYTAIKRYVVNDMIKYERPYPYLGGLMYRATQNVTDVEITHHDRAYGNSGYSLKKLIGLMMNGFTAFSVKPLRLSTYLGFVFAAIGFIYGVVIFIRKIFNPGIQLGYSSIMVTLLLIGGIIMVMLGLIGEYIGRIYICINNSPQYVIKEKISNDDN